MYIVFMVIHVLQENEDVINITNHKIIQVPIKDIIHQMLKDSRCVSKTKSHHNIFKITIIGFECHISSIIFSNVHQVVCST
jgi:hypothetical protein